MHWHMHKYANTAYLGDVPPYVYILFYLWVVYAPYIIRGAPFYLGGLRRPI